MNNLQNAMLGIGATRCNLRKALEVATQVQGIVILDLIRRTSELERDIAALAVAVVEDEKGRRA
jgi:hypothetical protein